MPKKLYMFDYNGKGVVVNDRKLKGPKFDQPPTNGYLNILILGDGFPYSCSSDGFTEDWFRQVFYEMRESIIKILFNTAPFNAFWPFINIFSRFESSNVFGVGVNGPNDTFFRVEAHNWGSNNPNSHKRKVEINQAHLVNVYNYIKNLTFTGFGLNINGEDEWLTPGKKSYGFIGFVGYDNNDGGQQHSDIEIQANKYFSYFAAVGTNDVIPFTFIHELGHAFGLGDEYEEDEGERIDSTTGVCQTGVCQYLNHPNRPPILDITPLKEPNVILRHELLPSTEQLKDDREKPLDANKMILSNNKFFPLMTTEDILWHTKPVKKYHVHPCWDLDNNPCLNDSTDYNWLFDPNQIIISEGASRYRRDIYRPNLTCYMRTETPEPDPKQLDRKIEAQFCKVCRLHIMKTIAEKEHWSLGT